MKMAIRGGLASFVAAVCGLVACMAGCGAEREETGEGKESQVMEMRLESSAFADGGVIPKKYTADGADVSPPLMWAGVPEGAASVVLICDDPDAPVGTWVHWVAYGIPTDSQGMSEGVPARETLADGTMQGKNDFGKIGYGGPAPPRGPKHRYFFKVYALDTRLSLSPGTTKKAVEKAMEGHVLAQGQLMGVYGR